MTNQLKTAQASVLHKDILIHKQIYSGNYSSVFLVKGKEEEEEMVLKVF